MENDFHLSIKNHQRKIGDVRDLFRNLTNDEKKCLLKEKILSEQKINELRRIRELEEQQEQLKVEQREYEKQDKIQDFLKKAKYNRFSNNFETSNKKMNENENSENNYTTNNNNNKLTSYEEQVLKTYGLLNQQANEDFGKYLEDDEDNDCEEDKKKYSENKDLNKRDEEDSNSRNRLSKKIRKNSEKIINSPDSIEVQDFPKEYRATDMSGFYSVELSPKEKERLEKLKQQSQQQSKGGLAGLKNKIKSLFTLEDSSYNLQAAPAQNYPPIGYDDVELSGLDSEENQANHYYFPRTIQDVQFGSSKIGYKESEEEYKEYYNQVDDLRKFDYEARVNNFKWKPNDNVAIMDDDMNLKYTKANKLNKESTKSSSASSNSNKAPKKPNKFNRLTEAIILKAKSLRT